MDAKLKRALRWIEERAKPHALPVAVNRRGFAEFVAHVFKIERPGKPGLWFCVAWLPDQGGIAKVRRVCCY